MKTKKSSLLVILALVASFVLAASCLFAACGTPEEPVETYAITWNVPADTTVAVEGYDALPETVEEGSQLVFTVTPPTGYTSTVKTTTTVSPKEGKYTVKITKDTTITVTNEKKVASLTVNKVEGAEFNYFAGEQLDKSTITVTVNYEVGESEVITTGFTVSPDMFVIGDTEFTVSYKGVTSAPVALDAAVEGREFGFVKVDLELGEDGKPYYVLYGTYSNYDEAKFTEVGFDFQEQGFYSEALGGAQGWTYVLYETKIEEFANGLFTLRVDMSALANNLATTGLGSMLFNPHMGFETPGDNANPNVDTENYEEGKTITTADGVSYTLHRTENSESVPQAETTWGMVGVIVSDPTAPKLGAATLEKSGDKVYLVINGTMTLAEGMTEQDAIAKLTALYAYYDYMGLGSRTLNDGSTTPAEGTTDRVALSYEDGTIEIKYDAEKGTFQIRLELTAIPAGQIYMFHTSDADGSNLAISVADDATMEVTIGTVTYTIFDSTQFSESWLASCLTIMVTDSSAA